MRRRLALAIAGVATVAVVLFAVPLGYVVQRSYRERELLRLQRDTVAATRSIDVGRPGIDPVEIPRAGYVLGVYDRRGRLVSGHGPPRADALVRAALATGRPVDRAVDGTLEAAAPLFAGERVSGALRATRDAGVVADRTMRAWLALAGLAATLVAAATLAALLLGRRLARPLELLSGAARRLGDGEFGVRAPRSTIPEANAIATALDTTAERLRDMLARERAFSADASHQLRTPLAALRLELEAMELRGDDSVELRGALRQVDRLQSTIDTLLAVARDSPRREAQTDLSALIDELAASHRGALAAHARPLRVAVPAALRPARAQPAVVREILDVLLSNAAQHGAGAVTVSATDDGRWMSVVVADEGPGVPDGQTVFERRSGSGHGIGLALATSLAHAEGGRLALTHAGPGPHFTLTLPVAEPDRRHARCASEGTASGGASRAPGA